jgi:hypothetical protein
MSDLSTYPSREDRADRMMTVVSGWAALVLGIFGLHRWVAMGTMDWWARASLILAFGLAVMWVWGYWPQIVSRVRAWARGGGLNTAIIEVVLVVSLVIINTVVRRRLPLKYDLTQNKRFTLAPRTAEILKSLKKPVNATVFLPAGAGRSASKARDLFKQYADASDNFVWKKVDPLVDQQSLLTFNPPPKLNSGDLTGAVLEYNGKRQDVTDFTEKEVTSAILKMTRDTSRKIVFLRGHGEPEVGAAVSAGGDPLKSVRLLQQELQDLQWGVESVSLYGKEARTPDPAEAPVLVIAGPERPLAAEEEKRVTEYLNQGGRVLLLLNTQGPSFSKFLQPWGIKTTDDLVLDRSQRGLVVVENDRSAHASVAAGRRVLFQPLRSVTAATPAPTGVTATEVLKSGSLSEVIPNYVAGKTNLQAVLNTSKPGPIGLAALAEKPIGSGDAAKKARILVVGDSAFIADQLAQLPSFYNLPLASGMINYLGEEDALVSIPPRDENTEQAFLTPDQGRLLPLLHLVDFPLLTLALAIFVYWKRR